MKSNQLKSAAGMLTAVVLILVVAGTYFYATQKETTQPEWSELSDKAKLDYLTQRESKREKNRAENRAELHSNSIYCARIDDDSLRDRCYDELGSHANMSQPTPTNTGASTLEPLRDASANDEQRYNRAELYGDSTYCDEITDEDLRLFCYEEISS